MKKILNFIILSIYIVYYIVLSLSLILGLYVKSSGRGNHISFNFWVLNMVITAGLCILLNCIFSILSIKSEQNLTNIVVLVLSVLSIPMFFVFGEKLSLIPIIIWNIYFLLLFILRSTSKFLNWSKMLFALALNKSFYSAIFTVNSKIKL